MTIIDEPEHLKAEREEAARAYVAQLDEYERTAPFAPVADNGNGNGPNHEDDPQPLTFEWQSVSDLLARDLTYRWTIRRLLVSPTYGQIAGELKTLKTYVSTFIDVAVASGKPLFGEFQVDEPGPVVTLIGEGGATPWTRRLIRVAEALGIDRDDLGDLPLWSTFDVAAIGSLKFAASLGDALDQHQPTLVHVDPYYAYHGLEVDSRNLHHEGDHLAKLSTYCAAGGASLLVNNHFNQTGAGGGLKRITGAGSGEWADTWLLLSHREKPDVAGGRFRLALEVGSRQWGGNAWNLDLNIGAFDIERGEHDGPITWSLEPATNVDQLDPLEELQHREDDKVIAARVLMLRMFGKARKPMTKTEALERTGTYAVKVLRRAFAELGDENYIEPVIEHRTDAAGRAQPVELWQVGKDRK